MSCGGVEPVDVCEQGIIADWPVDEAATVIDPIGWIPTFVAVSPREAVLAIEGGSCIKAGPAAALEFEDPATIRRRVPIDECGRVGAGGGAGVVGVLVEADWVEVEIERVVGSRAGAGEVDEIGV
jgi:hypothetical protein